MALKRLLNLPESETDRRLREVCDDYNAKVHAKVRVADVLRIEGSGIDDQHYRYALQAHFDFLVADADGSPLFAVEFDGRGHATPEAQARDRVKNALCERFELPLLRVNRLYLTPSYSNWDLLRWFCTVYFISNEWDADVASGRIPPEDAVFDPMFVSVRTKSGMRALELEARARAKLGQLFRSGHIPWHVPNFTLARGSDDTLRAIAWITTSENLAVVAETAMRPQLLGNWVHYAIRGIALNMLTERVHQVLDGARSADSIGQVAQRVKKFEGRFTAIMSLRSGDFA